MEKEFFYLGYYFDTNGKFVLKIGTTNDLERRAKEHTRNYRKAKEHTMPQESKFNYIWFIPLSKYNTLRTEDKVRELWKSKNFGHYTRNDRFIFDNPPETVNIKLRKNYSIDVA